MDKWVLLVNEIGKNILSREVYYEKFKYVWERVISLAWFEIGCEVGDWLEMSLEC